MNADLDGYSQGLVVAAPAGRVSALLRTPGAIARWWGQPVSGSAALGGHLEFAPDTGQRARMCVEQVQPGVLVLWRVVAATDHAGDWVGTHIRFRLSRIDAETTLLEFRHAGLTPLLRDYSSSVQAWRQRLANLERVATRKR